MCAPNGIPLGHLLLLPVGTVCSVQTLQGWAADMLPALKALIAKSLSYRNKFIPETFGA
jgi:hypothetical protein